MGVGTVGVARRLAERNKYHARNGGGLSTHTCLRTLWGPTLIGQNSGDFSQQNKTTSGKEIQGARPMPSCFHPGAVLGKLHVLKCIREGGRGVGVECPSHHLESIFSLFMKRKEGFKDKTIASILKCVYLVYIIKNQGL